MQTQCTGDAAIAAYDLEVLQAIRGTPSDSDGMRTRIGIRNERGKLYRLIDTFGLLEFLAVLYALREAGFSDSGLSGEATHQGCDTVVWKTFPILH